MRGSGLGPETVRSRHKGEIHDEQETFFSTLNMVVTSGGVGNASQYLQASSSVTQCPGTPPEVVTMNIVDAANGITLGNNKITVGEAGP